MDRRWPEVAHVALSTSRIPVVDFTDERWQAELERSPAYSERLRELLGAEVSDVCRFGDRSACRERGVDRHAANSKVDGRFEHGRNQGRNQTGRAMFVGPPPAGHSATATCWGATEWKLVADRRPCGFESQL